MAESSGATSGSSAAQVGREVDVHVGDDLGARLADQAARSARPRPFARAAGARRRAARAQPPAAIAGVASVLALSAITIRQVNGNSAARKRCRRRMLGSSAASSL